MLFNSYEFIFLFLPIAFLGYYLIARASGAAAITWLTTASLVFYAYWSIYALSVLLVSISLNYSVARKLADHEQKGRQYLLVIAVILNLIGLGYFKYADFFIENVNILRELMGQTPFIKLNVILPIGISFFTFTQIAYLIDSYEIKVREDKFLNYMLFVTFFPHLIAGPLMNHRDMMPQFVRANDLFANQKKIAIGVVVFTIGLAKKLLLADPISEYANILFDDVALRSTPSFLLSWAGSIAYSFQLYFDFSGYSDMAVGIALLFGIYLPINFNSPFKSKSIIEFWQRWHISLTKYIGKYLYAPITLGMMRHADTKSEWYKIFITLVLPTFAVFIILGLWHGPSWTYLVFGGMHGIYVIVNHMWRRLTSINIKAKNSLSPILRRLTNLIYWLITFLAVNVSFVVFRSNSIEEALNIYSAMFMVNYDSSELFNFLSEYRIPTYYLLLLVVSFIVAIFLPNINGLLHKSGVENYFLKNQKLVALCTGILFSLCLISLGSISPFIYNKF